MSLLTGLQAYYKLDSGALTTDASGNGKTLSNTGSTTNGTAFLGTGSASFNGSNTHALQIADSLGYTTIGDTTISAWMKFNNINSGAFNIDISTSTGSGKRIIIYTGHVSNKISIYNSGNLGDSSSSFSNGVWYHTILTVSNGATSLFVNTNLEATTTQGSTTGDTNGFGIGNAYAGTGAESNALIDEVGVWDRVLSGAEISQLYNGGAGLDFSSFGGGSTTNPAFLLNMV